MRPPMRLWFISMGLLLAPSCAVPVYDVEFCSPIPGGSGAVCDHFLSGDESLLTGEDWDALQANWAAEGMSTECVSSGGLGRLKTSLEQLCAAGRCHFQVLDPNRSLH